MEVLVELVPGLAAIRTIPPATPGAAPAAAQEGETVDPRAGGETAVDCARRYNNPAMVTAIAAAGTAPHSPWLEAPQRTAPAHALY